MDNYGMIINYYENMVDIFPEENKVLMRTLDNLIATRVSVPLGWEKEWIEIDKPEEEGLVR